MRIWRTTPAHIEKPIALTIGNFDGVHLGHQAMLTRLKTMASKLNLIACVMTFEPHPREFFAAEQAPTRLTSLREKLRLLAKSKVDCVRVYRFNRDFAKISPDDFIIRILKKELSVRWLLVGDDFRFGAKRAGDIALLNTYAQQNNFELEVMPNFDIDMQRVSSTHIRQALKNGNLDLARSFLGRPYSISGRVVNGDKLGRKIGFPTANIHLKQNKLPLSGIFVVKVFCARDLALPEVIMGVASLGVRPTIYEKGKPTLEVHLLDFNQDIYAQYLQVDFLHKLRDEEKFSSIDNLTKQIKLDVENARHYFLAQRTITTH